MCDLSIIVVSWNTCRMTLNCLRSVAEDCAGIAAEIIVVDNASGDGSPEAIAREFPEVRLIRNQANLGFAHANNQGLAIARGRYVALINSDAIALRGCLPALLRLMADRPEIGLCAPRVLNADRTLQPNAMLFPGFWNLMCETLGLHRLFPGRQSFAGRRIIDWAYDTVREVDVLVGCFWLARRTALDQVGPLDERFFMYGEDSDWCRRFHNAGWRVMLAPEGQAIHYGGASSSSQSVRFFVELKKSALLYWRKHHGRLGWMYCAAMILLHGLVRVIPGCILFLLKPARRGEATAVIKRNLACLAWLLNPLSSGNPKR